MRDMPDGRTRCNKCVEGQHADCENGSGDGLPCICRDLGHFSVTGRLGPAGRIRDGPYGSHDRVFDHDIESYKFVFNSFKFSYIMGQPSMSKEDRASWAAGFQESALDGSLGPDPVQSGSLPARPGPVHDHDEVIAEELISQRETYLAAIQEGRFHGQESQYGWVLPMHGSSRASCGKWGMPKGCLGGPNHQPDKAAIKPRVQWCGQISCPTCGPAAIERAAMRASERLAACALMLQSDIGPLRKKSIFNHLVVSFSANERVLAKDPNECVKITKRHMQRLKAAGLKGSLYVFHPWRFSKGLAAPYWSPHIHVLGLGYIENTQKGESDHKLMDLHYYGRMHATRSSRAAARLLPEGDRTIYRSLSTFTGLKRVHDLIGYLLSHAGLGLQGGRHAVTYTGEASYNKYRTEEILSNARGVAGDMSDMATRLLAVKYVAKDGDVWKYVCDSVAVQPVLLPTNALDLDIARPDLYGVVHLTPDQYRTAMVDGSLLDRDRFDSISRDNAPNPKSTGLGTCGHMAGEHEDRMALIIRARFVDVDDTHSEKYAHAVLYVDPATDRLCPHCLAKFRLVLPTGVNLPPDFDVDLEEVQTVDAESWKYWTDPEISEDGDIIKPSYDGLPYIEDSHIEHDAGVRVLPDWIEIIGSRTCCILSRRNGPELWHHVARAATQEAGTKSGHVRTQGSSQARHIPTWHAGQSG